MAKNEQPTPNLKFFPWEGGLSLTGSPDVKHPHALSLAEDIVYDYSGSKTRRGGQEHMHKIAIREGEVFEDHFLDQDLDTVRWPVSLRTIHANHSLSAYRRSILRVEQKTGTTLGVTSIQNQALGGLDDRYKMPHLVQTLSEDEAKAADQATTISVQIRFKGTDMPRFDSGFTEKGLRLVVQPGRPGDIEVPEWHLDCYFHETGIRLRDEGGTYDSISSNLPSYVTFKPALSDFGQASEWLTYRFDITYNGTNYVTSIFVNDVQLVENRNIDNDSVVGTGYVKLEFDSGTNTGTPDTLDIEVDSIDIDARVQEVRGLFEFSEDPTDVEGATRKRALYAGSRIYLDIGDELNLPCIDDNLPKNQFCAFEVFESRIRPFRVDQLVSANTSG